MKRLETYRAIITLFKNWPHIFVAKYLRRGDVLLKLREGSNFFVSNLNSNLLTILEVWYEKQYGEAPSGIVVDLGANIGPSQYMQREQERRCMHTNPNR